METCFNYKDSKTAFFSSDERKWITRIRKIQQKHPDEIKILAEPETNDGCIYVQLPANWLKINPPRKLTEEQKQEITDRFNRSRMV